MDGDYLKGKSNPVIILILIFFFSAFILGQDKQVDESKQLRKEILVIYKAGGEKGLRDFFKKSKKRITNKFIVDFVKAGVKERNEEWLKACKILAGEKKDEKTLADIYFKFGDYFRLITDYDKANYYFEKALQMYVRLNDYIGKGNVYLSRGDIYQITKIKSSTLEMYKKALVSFTNAKYLLGKGNVYLRLGNIYLGTTDYSKALDMYEKALVFFDEIGNPIGKGNVYQSKGDIYFYLGDKSKALEMYDKALTLFEKTGDLVDLGNLYMRKGIIYSKSGERKWMIEMYDKALHSFRKAKDFLGQGNVYSHKGDILLYSGDNLNAMKMYENALNLFKKIGDLLGQGNVHLKMGLIYFYIGDNVRSMRMYEKSLQFFEKKGNTLGLGNAYEKMGNIYFRIGDNLKAMEMYDKAMPFFRKAKNPTNQGNLYMSKGKIYFRIGDYSSAIEMYDKSINLFEKEGAHLSLGSVFFRKGDIYFYSGDILNALKMYEKGIRIFKKEKIPMGLGIGYFRKGDVYLRTADYSGAIEMYNKALPFFDQTKNPLGKGNVCWRKGDIFYYTGENTKALEMYDEALPFFEQAGTPLGQGDIYRRKGDIYSKTADIVNASKMYDRALLFFEKAGELRGKVNIFYGKGGIYLDTGDILRALEMYDKALVINKKIGDIESEAYILHKKAQIFAKFGKKIEAGALFERAISELEKMRTQTAFPEIKRTFMEKVYKLYEDAVLLLLENRYYDKGFKYAEMIRARVFLDQMAEGLVGLEKGLKPELKEERDRLVGKLSALSRQMQETPGKEEKKLQKLKEVYLRVESQFEDLLIKIRLENTLYAAVNYPQPVSVRDLQTGVLKKGETLLSYFIAPEKAYAFIVSGENFKVRQLKVNEKEINGYVERYLLAIKENNARDMKRYGSLIYEKLFRPLEKYLKGSKKIIIVPAGQLETIPFESLIASKKKPGRPVYLLEKYRIKYIQSASILSVLRKHYQRNRETKNFIGFGDPVYDYENFQQGKPEQGSKKIFATESTEVTESILSHEDTRRDTKEKRLSSVPSVSSVAIEPPQAFGDEIKEIYRSRYARAGGIMNRLPHSGEEIQTIARLFEQKSQKCKIHLRDHASEEHAKSPDLKEFDYIHFSCHGLLNDDFQSLVLSQIPGAKEDGYLTLNEIMNCDYNAKLVVLSACQTGAGKMERAEGVTGLTRAVMYAGTPAVMASLWKVDDTATKELMVKFYKNMLEKNMDKAEALRQAKLELIKNKKYTSPLFWSAFVLYGE
jgi:CHAT domain-containing protein/predicted negative regulator of RcsB-dependent stress response